MVPGNGAVDRPDRQASRDLQVELGLWHTEYMLFSRWRRKDFWPLVIIAMACETAIGHILVDSTSAAWR